MSKMLLFFIKGTLTLRSEVRSQQSLSNSDQPASKQVRRVLPEHEGKYKITLPSGSTERSKEILAKKAMCKYDELKVSKNS